MCSYTSTTCSISENRSRLQKYFRQSAFDGLFENTVGSWGDDASSTSFDLVTFQYLGCDGKIFVSSVCRGSDESLIDRCAFDLSDFLFLIDISRLRNFGNDLSNVDIVFILVASFGPCMNLVHCLPIYRPKVFL